MPKYTISTLSPIICDSFGITDKYGQSVENAMEKFSGYQVIVERDDDRWAVTPISHFHKPDAVAAPVEQPKPVQKPKPTRTFTRKKRRE